MSGAAWPAGGAALSVALGRHALALIAQDLRSRGVRNVAIPAYHCLTMRTPFALEGFHMAYVPVAADLMADPVALRSLVDDAGASSWAVLHCGVFGAAPSPALRAALADVRRTGGAVIADDTHRWPLASHVEADYVAVSARKLLNLPDGAFAAGALMRPGGPRPRGRGMVDRAETEAWLAGDVDRAEDLMDDELTPVVMSPEAMVLADALDLPALVAERRDTVAALHDALLDRQVEVISPRDGIFCVALRHADAERVVLDLARAGIDGPVWWPRPSGWQGSWPDDVVTLPVNEGEPGVERVLAAFDRYVE